MSGEDERRAREIADELLLDGAMLATGVELIGKAIAEAEARGAVRWRPVSERPAPGWYLWLDNEGECEVKAYRGDIGGGFGLHIDERYTHWMPLPPPPTEEQKR